MGVLAVHRQEPNWPDDPARPRHAVVIDGVTYWAETDGPAPELSAVRRVLGLDIDLTALKEALKARVDADAEAARLCYITPGAGMAMTYQEKFAQAQGVFALGEQAANAMSQEDREAQFPTLSASVGIEAPTLWDAAQLVLQKYTQFAQLSLVIERTRLAGKAAIKAASDVQSVRAAYEAIAWPTP